MYRRVVTVAAITVIMLVFAAAPSVAALPVVYDGLRGYAHISSTASPPGANNWTCKPSAAHPYPAILVHGTFADMSDSWQALSPLLYNNGYCVFAFNYGSYFGSDLLGIDGIGEIANSARQLASFVNKVLSATGARKVDVVGHSQGGMMPRYYLKFLGGASKVETVVGLAPSNHGTTLDGLSTLAGFFRAANTFVGAACPSCREQETRSSFLKNLNSGGDTMPGVHYTVIQSSHDEVVTPYRSAFLSGPHVTNILLQKQCSQDHGDHLSMPYDHIADTDVLNALDPAHQATPPCTTVNPIVGG